MRQSPRNRGVPGLHRAPWFPKTPDELSDHDCLLFTGFSRPREWRLVGPEGPLSVTVTGRVATNNVDALCDAALGGQGVTMGATLQAWPYLRSGELIRVMPDYEFAPSAIFAVFPSARQLSTKVRAMIDFLGEEWTDPPKWDLELNGKVPGF